MAGLIKQKMDPANPDGDDENAEPAAETQQETAAGTEPPADPSAAPPDSEGPGDEQGAADEQEPPDAAGGDQGDENDPNFQQALKFAMDALYKNGAAKHIAEQLRSTNDVPGTLADAAYQIVQITDEKTQGAVPDELLVLFASRILEEVGDIATAAGIKVQASDIAQAMKTMILRYLGENGVDTTQLQGAMDKVNPDSFNQAADKVSHGAPDDASAPAGDMQGQ